MAARMVAIQLNQSNRVVASLYGTLVCSFFTLTAFKAWCFSSAEGGTLLVMHGMNGKTGKHLGGIAHLKQSIQDILTTPVGTRVMRREYGSRLPELVDAPTNPETILDIYGATAEALNRWEPRFRLESVSLSSTDGGSVLLDMVGEYLPDGKRVTLDGIIVT